MSIKVVLKALNSDLEVKIYFQITYSLILKYIYLIQRNTSNTSVIFLYVSNHT